MTLSPDDFSKSGISATIPGCKATAHRSLISAAPAVLPAVMPNKASPKAIVAETLRMLRRFILALHTGLGITIDPHHVAPIRTPRLARGHQRASFPTGRVAMASPP